MKKIRHVAVKCRCKQCYSYFSDMTLKILQNQPEKWIFNALVDLLINTGYTPEYYPLKVNRIVEVLNGMSEADYKDYCTVCKKPFIHAPDRYDSCPTCSAKKCKVAIMRYSQSLVPFE
uniref:Uncharacterized protein n=1 Tax=Klebsiella pneumoniae TaxID=573 RepID=A0A8B0SZJ9_KLEPN|nr:hypothetical protein [Klebsiella pneumoniae]